MIVRVYYDHDALFIDGIRTAIIPGTLAAVAIGNAVSITTVNSTQPLAAGDFSVFADQNGDTFDNVADCLTYLQTTCSQVLQRVPTVSAIAGEPIAAGMPVALSRSDGTMRNARGDTYALSFLAGIASVDIVVGFMGEVVRSSISLPDWTSVVGATALSLGQPYFLSPRGGMTTQPSTTPGPFSVRTGYASAPNTMIFTPSDPVTL